LIRQALPAERISMTCLTRLMIVRLPIIETGD